MALLGGIGIIHKNMTMAQQAAEVRKVKKHESVIVKDPVTVSPKAKLEDLLRITWCMDVDASMDMTWAMRMEVDADATRT